MNSSLINLEVQENTKSFFYSHYGVALPHYKQKSFSIEPFSIPIEVSSYNWIRAMCETIFFLSRFWNCFDIVSISGFSNQTRNSNLTGHILASSDLSISFFHYTLLRSYPDFPRHSLMVLHFTTVWTNTVGSSDVNLTWASKFMPILIKHCRTGKTKYNEHPEILKAIIPKKLQLRFQNIAPIRERSPNPVLQ